MKTGHLWHQLFLLTVSYSPSGPCLLFWLVSEKLVGRAGCIWGSRFLTRGLYSRLQFLCVSLCLSSSLSVSAPLCLSVCLFLNLSICLSWSLSVAVSVCTSLPVILCLSLYLLFFWLFLHLSVVLSLSVCVSPSGFLFLTPFLSFPRSLIGEDIKISAILSDCVLVIVRQNEDP